MGDQHRYAIFRVNFAKSPKPQFVMERNNIWATEYGPDEILEKAIYLLLKKAFQDFAPAHHIFRHQAGQSLCASRVWFALLDKFPLQSPLIRTQFLTRNILYTHALEFCGLAVVDRSTRLLTGCQDIFKTGGLVG